jgi:inorganic phosphate transporter, PiT family
MNGDLAGGTSPIPHLDKKPHVAGTIAFLLVLAGGIGYAALSIANDLRFYLGDSLTTRV